ncbi:protein FAM3C [Halichoeres trimaculatus]|uniref:protein FAM3C n=1 Tax=Halichoeres trimaculatus TaxID=147232 RepID=UPI003D9F50A2
MKECPLDQFSFYVQSGAADAVAPKICIQNRMVLGTQLKNAGPGINIVIMDGKTGAVTKTDHFNMYSGNVEPLIELLKDIQTGSTVLFASFDDPATKLNEEARTLIAEMGSSSVKSLRFRDSWAFVGAKGSAVKDKFEEHIKNDRNSNKYTNWPELVYFEGCIPKFQE